MSDVRDPAPDRTIWETDDEVAHLRARIAELERRDVERAALEQALWESQERYALATKAAKVGVWDWDLVTGAFYLDPNIKAFIGYEDHEIPNDLDQWARYVHPDDREGVLQAARDHLEGRTSEYTYEHRMLHRDGSVRWILVRGLAMRDETGRVVRMIGTDADITRRKRAEERLGMTEERFRAASEHVPGVIYSYDVETSGRRTLHHIGPGLDELIGDEGAMRVEREFDHLFDRVHPDDFDELRAAAAEVTRTGHVLDFACRLRHDSGDYTWVRSIARPTRLIDGRVRWHVVLIDVTAQRRIERMLRSLVDATSDVTGEAFFCALVRSLAGALEVRHAYVCEHDANDPGTVHTLAFWSDDGFDPNLSFDVTSGPLMPVLDGEDVFRPRQVRGEFPACPVLASLEAESVCAVPVRNQAGDVVGHLALVHDGPMPSWMRDQPVLPILASRVAVELDRWRYEAELRMHIHREHLLLRELNHRVRNNLASLSALVDVARRKANDPAVFATMIQGRIQVMATVHNLLARSNWASTDLHALVDALAPPLARAALRLHGAPLEISSQQAAPVAMVLHELLTNASKYGAISTPDGRVDLAWEIDVDDDGERRITLEWTEAGGPRIERTPSIGTGTSLVNGFVRSDLRGAAEMTYPVDGAQHRFVLRLDPVGSR